MFPSYDSDVIDFKMFKFKNREAFHEWISGIEYSQEYSQIDISVPFVASMCQRSCLNEDFAIYDICDNLGKPISETWSIAFNATEVYRYLIEVPFSADVVEHAIKAKEEEIKRMQLELAQLRERQKLL